MDHRPGRGASGRTGRVVAAAGVIISVVMAAWAVGVEMVDPLRWIGPPTVPGLRRLDASARQTFKTSKCIVLRRWTMVVVRVYRPLI